MKIVLLGNCQVIGLAKCLTLMNTGLDLRACSFSTFAACQPAIGAHVSLWYRGRT